MRRAGGARTATTAEAAGAAGDLLYRWGNPAAYGRGGAGAGVQRFFYQHDVRWIPDGWQGAGNTMICSGTGGQLFEVTRAGEVVWEYRNPFWGDVRNVDGNLPQPRVDERPFATFRAARIPVDHPALAGRTLEPPRPAARVVRVRAERTLTRSSPARRRGAR